MFNRLRSWFDGLSGPKKVLTAVVAVAAGVGTVVGAIDTSIGLYERVADSARGSNPLELADVGFIEVKLRPNGKGSESMAEMSCGDPRGCPVPALDFKVANLGEDPVIVKRANFQVERVWVFTAPYEHDPDKCAYLYMPPSYNYGIELPVKEAPYTVSKDLSQSIKAGETDRFTITPHRDDRTAVRGEDYVFLMTVSLIYNADSLTVTTEDVLYGELDTDAGVLYSYRPDQCMKLRGSLDESDVTELVERNTQAAAEVRRYKATSNPFLRQMLESVAGE